MHDFRSADVAAGGQGAPLVPAYHAALAEGLPHPVLVLNIGGVANLTWIDRATVLACDTGPGNALLDDLCAQHIGEPMDRDGRLALAGTPDAAVLAALLANPFFARPAPKSLDRQDFADALEAVAHLPLRDAAATLAAFTAGRRGRHAPALPAGAPVGDRRRPTQPGHHGRLVQAFACKVEPVETAGWDGDALEAECFAFLAARSLRGLPLSYPGTTGVPHPVTGGRIHTP